MSFTVNQLFPATVTGAPDSSPKGVWAAGMSTNPFTGKPVLVVALTAPTAQDCTNIGANYDSSASTMAVNVTGCRTYTGSAPVSGQWIAVNGQQVFGYVYPLHTDILGTDVKDYAMPINPSTPTNSDGLFLWLLLILIILVVVIAIAYRPSRA